VATVIARPISPPLEVPGPSRIDDADPLGIRLGKPFHLDILKDFGVSTQLGTIWLGTWGVLSVLCFALGSAVILIGAMDQMNGNLLLAIKYFANIQLLPPDGMGFPSSLRDGGYWMINLTLWALSVVFWAGRCYDRIRRYEWRPYLLFSWLSAILLTATIWVFRPLAMGNWSEAPGLGLNADLDWAQNFSVLWGNLYYNPWHMLAIFFLFGSTMLWGMHGATILATASEGSHLEDAEIKDMHSGSHKSMLFWRWTMGFNANPKTIHDWLWWFATGTVLASALGIITTGTLVKDWYAWGVDHGWVQQYGPLTRSAINGDVHAPIGTTYPGSGTRLPSTAGNEMFVPSNQGTSER
jgi:photosynthetic reaction center M subunit